MRLEIPVYSAMDQSDFDSVNIDMAYPPSSSHSFSSAASSFGVFTPTSGRSISPNSHIDGLDFSTSFGSAVDSFPYGLTPPPSTTSPYFQGDVRYGDSCVLYQSQPPVTPSRDQQGLSSQLLNSYGPHGPHTPAQVSGNYFSFGTELAPSPMPRTPTHGSPYDQSWDTWQTTWPHGESPIDFVKKEEEDFSYPSIPAPAHQGGRILFDVPVKKKTTALRKTQPRSSPTNTGGIRKRTKQSAPPTKALAHGLEVPVAEANKILCDWDGCDRKFKRKEHMVRHRNANHLDMYTKCDYCPKRFNRGDNFHAHEYLHTLQRETGKVQFVPEAARKILEKHQKFARKGRAAKLTTGKAGEELQAMLDEIDD